jgi:hypothetical protein
MWIRLNGILQMGYLLYSKHHLNPHPIIADTNLLLQSSSPLKYRTELAEKFLIAFH